MSLDLEPLMRQNFLQYASYVIMDRAIPDVRDGCKPVQRRILHTLFSVDDGKFHKVANIIGEAMKLHPHGDVSIGDALVVLANKEYFIEKQGNFGNVLTGHQAAASRYIECRLTPLAKETLFNNQLTEWQPSYDGRRQEPVFLAAKLPVVLMLGTEGIAVGMTTKILPHNLVELWQAQVTLLRGGKATVVPDFVQGGLMDASDYDDGRGKVRVRARIEEDGDKRVVIREIPFGTTTESLIASIESAIQKGKVKIGSINDFTGDAVEIELTLPRGTYAEEVIPQLYAYTDCEVSIGSNVVVIEGRHPRECSIGEVLRSLTERLRQQIQAELTHQLAGLNDKMHALMLDQIFLANKIYKKLESVTQADKLADTVERGMAPYAADFVRPLEAADVARLLELRIRRISAFDLDKNRADIAATQQAMAGVEVKLKHLTRTTIDYLLDLKKRYGKGYGRRTELATFAAVDRKTVARQNIKATYDAETGFFGADVKTGELSFALSEYDLMLAVGEDGLLRVMTPQPKVWLGKVRHLAPFDPEAQPSFVVIYSDAKKVLWGKRIVVSRFVRNREYALCPEGGKLELLVPWPARGKPSVHFTTGARGKGSEQHAALLADVKEVSNLTARGQKLSSKAATKVRVEPPLR
jgi:topoisomerase-4 subunit A